LVSSLRKGATKLARSLMLRVLVPGPSEMNSAGQPAGPQFWLGLVPMKVSAASVQPSPSLSQGTPIATEPTKVESGVAISGLPVPTWPWLDRVRR
jgi:hypothetical protein